MIIEHWKEKENQVIKRICLILIKTNLFKMLINIFLSPLSIIFKIFRQVVGGLVLRFASLRIIDSKFYQFFFLFSFFY